MKNVPASIHARLQNLARQRNRPFQEILQYYCIERFLFRLSKTAYGTQFVLKGGLIFYALGLHLRRPTRDIDFLGFTHNSTSNLIQIFRSACSIPTPEDGLSFQSDEIRAEEIMADADYPGIRITLRAFLGNAVVPIQVDISFTDVITPGSQDMVYPVLLDTLDAPVLKSYPPESIVSEKFQAMVRLAELNSRWKDFYDVWMLSESCNFDGEVLVRAIAATFAQRATPIPTVTPVALTSEFANSRQRSWDTFFTRNRLAPNSIKNFDAVVTRLRSFLMPPVEAIPTSAVFRKLWSAGSGWS